jgi:Na+-transporting methylmalonyl-CoA/oxaloacetate decarboxylase gamma subunit
MGLVFAAIILLWLLMTALMALPFKQPGPAREEAPPVEAGDMELKARAAALAVAVALAEQGQSSARPLAQPPTALVSAWQLGMRTRQMYEKGEKR